MIEGSKVNLSSTKYEKTSLKLHFLSTNSYLIATPQAITEDLGNKKQKELKRCQFLSKQETWFWKKLENQMREYLKG